MSPFSKLGVVPSLLPKLEKLGFNEPTPVQASTIPVGIGGDDLIAIAQTGTGKTLAFALTVLSHLESQHDARAIVLTHNRETAQQVHDVFEKMIGELPISSCLVIGGVPDGKQTTRLNKRPRLIVATPGRLNDHLLKNKLLLQGMTIVVLDEADRMLDMGFLPQLKSIRATMRGNWQTLMYSASFNDEVAATASVFTLKTPVMLRMEDAESPVNSLRQKIVYLNRRDKFDHLLDEIDFAHKGLTKSEKSSILVFAASQEECEFLSEHLTQERVRHGAIHGGMSQGHRTRIVREFREKIFHILVTTDLLARGLDIPHIETVISYDLPYHPEDFLHRIGRTARAGRDGQAITFVTPSDREKIAELRPYLEGASEVVIDPN
jgi:superfamily II DNA/RNA helicase